MQWRLLLVNQYGDVLDIYHVGITTLQKYKTLQRCFIHILCRWAKSNNVSLKKNWNPISIDNYMVSWWVTEKRKFYTQEKKKQECVKMEIVSCYKYFSHVLSSDFSWGSINKHFFLFFPEVDPKEETIVIHKFSIVTQWVYWGNMGKYSWWLFIEV